MSIADRHVSIPMMGMVASFNVSVAAAIILAEAQRQRLQKGLYDTPCLDTQTYRNMVFRWGHPRVAAYCDRHGLDYPALDEAGQIIGKLP